MKSGYDVTVIGAGIGGLVCGCYLAKAGLKTLIVEKNAKAGGYCTSFEKNGFIFDSCAHALGGLRENGSIKNILKELDICDRISIKRYSPADIIISPEYMVHIWSDLNKTIAEFQENFPREAKNIKRFFEDIVNIKNTAFAALKPKTFKEFLDEYFEDFKLKSILSFPVFGNAGLPPSLISAFTAVSLYKEFIIDGGYYPQGGMQEFPDILLKRFKEYKGDIALSSMVSGIIVEDNCVKGINIAKEDLISSRYVVSNVDAHQTFTNLIGKEIEKKCVLNRLNNLVPSLSIFTLYLGTDGAIKDMPKGSNVWFLLDYDIEDMYHVAEQDKLYNSKWFMLRLAPNGKSLTMLITSAFENSEYWKTNKKKLIEFFIKKIERLIPDLSKHIVFKDAATPDELYKWTLNYRGAAYGWAGIPSQFAVPGFSRTTSIKNLYLTGHWTTLVQGITGVAYLGKDVAGIILNKEKNKI